MMMLARLFEVRDTPSGGRGYLRRDRCQGHNSLLESKRIPGEGINRLSGAEKNIVLRFGYENADGSHTCPAMK
jgi:hypothetical protein